MELTTLPEMKAAMSVELSCFIESRVVDPIADPVLDPLTHGELRIHRFSLQLSSTDQLLQYVFASI